MENSSRSATVPSHKAWKWQYVYTHAAVCSQAESWPGAGHGSSPSPPWSLPPGVRMGPFPLDSSRFREHRDSVLRRSESGPDLTSSSESSSPPYCQQTTKKVRSTCLSRPRIQAESSCLDLEPHRVGEESSEEKAVVCGPVVAQSWCDGLLLTSTTVDTHTQLSVGYSTTNRLHLDTAVCFLWPSLPPLLSQSFIASALHWAQLKSRLLTHCQLPPNYCSH